MPATTPDGRFVVVGGRRWRATDPSIPEPFRQELVDELMSARRAVQSDEASARVRVQRAKVALGERGTPWWEPGPDDARLEATLLALAGHRRPKTICPSDVARAVGGDGWRSLLPRVRDVARSLARDGTVDVTQRGEVLDPAGAWRGPIRIRAAGADAAG